MSKTTEISADALQGASRALDAKSPVYLVNLLRFRREATYAEPSGLEPCSGREAYYSRYVPAFHEVANGLQAVPSWLGNAQVTIVAPDGEAWDDVVIVEYPTFEALRTVIESPEYEAVAAPHRRAALEDWRFLGTTKMHLPQ